MLRDMGCGDHYQLGEPLQVGAVRFGRVCSGEMVRGGIEHKLKTGRVPPSLKREGPETLESPGPRWRGP